MIEAVGRISARNFILIAPESQQFKYEIASKHVAYMLSYSTGKATQLTMQSNLHSEPVDSFSNYLDHIIKGHRSIASNSNLAMIFVKIIH